MLEVKTSMVFLAFQRSFFFNNFSIFIVVHIASTTFITICQLTFDFCFLKVGRVGDENEQFVVGLLVRVFVL
jgi:hypothetical protein